MRWFHVLGAVLLTLVLSFVSLSLISNFIAPLSPASLAQGRVAAAPGASTSAIPALPPAPTSPPGSESPAFAGVTVPILLYHAIGEYEGVGEELFVSAAIFEQQLDYLVWAGFTTITLEQWWQHLENGAPLPAKPIIISFDDGYRSFYNYAMPALLARDMKATLFIISNHITLPRTMTPGMIRDAYDMGMEIASHSANHLDLVSCSPAEVLPQLVESKEFLEGIIRVPVYYLAYPGGIYNDFVVAAAQEAGYRLAAGTVPGLNSSATDYMQLHRILIQRSHDLVGFVHKLEEYP
ncbi:MAG: polysaccharide deacetylase family protein [Symbiobacteriaceae bacterium]|nr:polysaccharide deacetylase family protein [Symbiobacteriaceae bacterium]